jgi:hypothetical protein
MLKPILALGALLTICGVMSNREERRRARERFRPWSNVFWILTAIGLAIMLLPWWRLFGL